MITRILNTKLDLKALILLNVIVIIIYYKLIDSLSNILLNILILVFIVLQILLLYIFFTSLKSKKEAVFYGLVLLLSFLIVIGGRIYLYSSNYVIDESYDPWNNIYYKFDGTELVEGDSIQYDTDNISSQIKLSNVYENVQDHITRKDYIYSIASTSNGYDLLKADKSGNIKQVENIESQRNFVYYRIIEGDTDDIYYYQGYCPILQSPAKDCNYQISSFDSDLNNYIHFQIEGKEVYSMTINQEYVYVIAGDENQNFVIMKYDLNGEKVMEKRHLSKGSRFHTSPLSIFVSNNEVYIYQELQIYNKNNNSSHVGFEQFAIYDMKLDYIKDIIIDNNTSIINKMRIYKGSTIYDSIIPDTPGGEFTISNKEGGYIFKTPFLTVELLDTKEDLYMNIKTLDVIHSNDFSEEYNIHTNLIFTMILLLTIPMYMIYALVYIYTNIFQDNTKKKKIRVNKC